MGGLLYSTGVFAVFLIFLSECISEIRQSWGERQHGLSKLKEPQEYSDNDEYARVKRALRNRGRYRLGRAWWAYLWMSVCQLIISTVLSWDDLLQIWEVIQ